MKSPYYVATVVNAYRRRIDALLNSTATPAHTALLRRELDAASHREYSRGFYFGEMPHEPPDKGIYQQTCRFVGVVRERLSDTRARVEQRNRIARGDTLEVLSPHSLGLAFEARDLADTEGNPLEAASVPMTLFDMDAPADVCPGDLLRIRLEDDLTAPSDAR